MTSYRPGPYGRPSSKQGPWVAESTAGRPAPAAAKAQRARDGAFHVLSGADSATMRPATGGGEGKLEYSFT